MARVRVAILATLILVGCTALAAPTPTPTAVPTATTAPRPTATAAAPAVQLEIISAKATRQSQKYWQVDGAVKNIGDKPLANVQAVAILIDAKEKKQVGSEIVMLAYNPIQPGQTSPFKLMVQDRPGVEGGWFEFKVSGGGTLGVADSNVKDGFFFLIE
jgi:hypothetical protein